jgi:Raf kinase inhibitor-like YbhB/YbcL family protein
MRQQDSSRHRIVLQSPTLTSGQPMPRQHTTQGSDLSPALTWRSLPPDTKEIAVALEDQDTHYGNEPAFLQWLVYGIPANARGLPQGLPATQVLQDPPDIQGARQARTHFDITGYTGPEPPAGELHHYHFRVYALDAQLAMNPGLPASTVLAALQPHIIGEGEIAVTYQRTP